MSFLKIAYRMIIVSSFLTAMAQQASAFSWNCRNFDYEISCADGKCSAVDEGNFTPMDISLDDNRLSVCAYTGCWEGASNFVADGKLLYVRGKNLKWSGTNPSNATFQLMMETDAKIGVLLGEGFAHPLRCEGK